MKEKVSLNQMIKEKDEFILAQNHEIQIKDEKLFDIEKELSLEKNKTNDTLKIKVADEQNNKRFAASVIYLHTWDVCFSIS